MTVVAGYRVARSSWARPLPALRIIVSAARRLLPGASRVVVPFDSGRSRVVADLSTALGLGLYRYGLTTPQWALLRDRLRPGDTFIDGGANIGLFSLVAAARVGASGKVLAFEPAARARKSLTENIRLSRFDWVDVRAEALDASVGRATLHTAGGDGMGLSSFSPATLEGRQKEVVETTTLDIVCRQLRAAARLVKLDLEGAEFKALSGARWMLEECRPELIVELEERHLSRQGTSVEEVVQLLGAYGYNMFRITQLDADPDAYALVPLRLDDDSWIRDASRDVLAVPTSSSRVGRDRPEPRPR